MKVIPDVERIVACVPGALRDRAAARCRAPRIMPARATP